MYRNNEIIKLYNYDDNQVIWRYMDFTKFLSMLQYQALFFCTCKKMQDMDPFEGEYPKRNLEKIQKEKEFWQLPSEYLSKAEDYKNSFLQNVAINCWHANDTENAAMWRMYLSSQEGVAIKSTIRKLKKAFENNEEDVIYIGDIQYNNYDLNNININTEEYLQDIDSLVNRKQEVSNSEIFNTLCEYYFPLIMSKRKEFEYGNEIRLVSPIRQSTRRKRVKDFGKLVNVDLDVLINSIIVSPNATDWFVNLVKDTMKSYNLEHKKVYKSKIYEKIYN